MTDKMKQEIVLQMGKEEKHEGIFGIYKGNRYE